MPEIRPFKAVIYNSKKIEDVSRVVAPPYDVISLRMQEELYKKHEDNVIRLILGKIKNTDTENDNRYTRAERFFTDWLKNKILIQDTDEAIYLYGQKYKYNNKAVERLGFISIMKLEMGNDNKVLPHENTLKAPKADRLNLMRRVKANLSPVFMLYEDDGHRMAAILKKQCSKTRPFINVTLDGVNHRVWRITDKNALKDMMNLMSGKNIFIADGHHRYETAINYACEAGESGLPRALKDDSKFFMAYFTQLDDKTLTILPTHRLIKDPGRMQKDDILTRLENYFVIEKFFSGQKMLSRLKSLKKYHAFGICFGKKEYYVIKLKDERSAEPFMGGNSDEWKSLDVSLLHLFVIQHLLGMRDEDDNIEFVKDAEEAIQKTEKGECAVAFILNPTKVGQVKKVAEHGEKMPRKATYFYPKLLSGLVMRKLG